MSQQPYQGQPTNWTNAGQPPQQGYPQFTQYPQYPQQGYPQYPQQGQYLPQPPMMPPTQPPKKKAWYKRPWGIVLIIFLSLGVCGGISNALTSSNGSSATATSTVNGVAQTSTTVPTKAAQPTAAPTKKPTPTPKPKPTQSAEQQAAVYKASTTSETVSDLDKQGNSLQGTDVHFTGKILNFVKDSSGTTAGANISDPNDATTSVVQIVLPLGVDLTQLNQGDIVDVWGNDAGTVSGTNAFGGTIQEVQISVNYMTDQTTGYKG